MDDFVLAAALAGGIAAVVSGPVGYMLVLRGQSFAGHALSHVGFAGATGAALAGVSPLAGLVAATVASGAGMGLLGAAAAERDVAIGVVLTVALGFGLLFLNLFTGSASATTALLFGNVLAVEPGTLWALAGMALFCLAGLAALYRPLLAATLLPEQAAARGVPVRTVSVLFLALAGLAVAACVPVVGVLLTFALMVGPGAAAQRWTARPGAGMALAAALAMAAAWGGLALAMATDWPPSFWIALLSGGAYAVSAMLRA